MQNTLNANPKQASSAPGFPVLVAGIGGASLGTEICKALKLAGGYEIIGCDISPTAYGLYGDACDHACRIDRGNYVDSILETCARTGARHIIPGGEQPMVLLAQAQTRLQTEGITLVGNSARVISTFSDKANAFRLLSDCGIPIPRTVSVQSASDVGSVGLPCIVKPATGSGGSANVFYATTLDEAMVYADFIRRNGAQPVAQEYIDEIEGEFTIGVLSLPGGRTVGAIALRRALDAKLSVAYRGRGGLVSSGYSQGRIDVWPELCAQAERIAEAIESEGPINVQGRVRDGVLLPFEINPRFSASTYLRAMAGFNEIDIMLAYLRDGRVAPMPEIRSGWYLRSLTEQFVSDQALQ